MKKLFIITLVSVFLLSYVLPTHTIAAKDDTTEERDTFLNEDYSIESGEENVIDDSNDEKIVVEHHIEDDIGYIETSINNQGVEVESQLELDLETNQMIIDAQISDDDGNLIEKSFEVAIEEVKSDEDFSAVLTDLETSSTYEIDSSEASASWYPLVVIAINVARIGIQQAIKKYGKTAVTKATGKYGKKATAKTLKKVKFKNQKSFDDHWIKHKKEFPGYTKSKYLTRAQTLVNAKGKHILTKKRSSNGDLLRYNKDTNELLILSKDDVIKTLFKPKHPSKSKGYEYFKNQ